jgi:hypothetical protein
MALPDPLRSPGQPLPAGGPTPAGITPPRPVPFAPQPIPAMPQSMPAVPQPVRMPPSAGPAMPRPIPVPRSAVPGQVLVRDKPVDEDATEQIKRLAVRNAPPWLISCVVHLLLVVVLGLWLMKTQQKPSGIYLDVLSDELGEQLLDASSTLSVGELTDEQTAMTDDRLAPVEDPFAEPPAMPLDFAGMEPAPNFDQPKISQLLIGREPGTKKLLLGKYGGNGESEEAVAAGLKWLARQQRKDGLWSLNGPYRDGALDRDVPEAATALALLAFQGAGHTHRKGEFNKQVAAGIKALLRLQGADGNFYQGGKANNAFYAHGQCTMAVCELYAMTKDPDLLKPAELAVKYCIDSQDPELGGWKYLPRSTSDTSVTGWIVMALETARMAGIQVPSPTLEKVKEFLDRVSDDSGGAKYSYEPNLRETYAMTAEGLLCRQYLGWRRDHPKLLEGADYLLTNLPRMDDRDVYYWYYGTQVMHHLEGEYWAAWNGVLRDLLVGSQEKSGPEKGSWDPRAPTPDNWASKGLGGRLYTTCLSIFMLEVYYRHISMYGVGG